MSGDKRWWLQVDGLPEWMQNRQEVAPDERTPNWARLIVLYVVVMAFTMVVASNIGAGWIGGPVGALMGIAAPRMRFFSKPSPTEVPS